MCTYIPPLEVEEPLLHSSQASPAHTYTVGLNGRPGVSMSRLLAGLQASRATVRYDIVSLRCLKAREEDRQTDRGADRKVLYRCEQKNRQLQTAL